MHMDEEHHKAHHKHHEEHHEHQRERRGSRWLTGFMFGGLAGLTVSLLIAPQSGRQTRELLRYKAVQLRQLAEQTVTDTREKVNELSEEARMQAMTFRQRGEEFVEEQKQRVTRTATAVKQAATETWQQDQPMGAQPTQTESMSAR